MTRREELAREAPASSPRRATTARPSGPSPTRSASRRRRSTPTSRASRTSSSRRCGRAPRPSTGRSTRSRGAAPTEKIRLALRGHLRVVAGQIELATVFVQEWRYLDDERREQFVSERRRYEERVRALFREGASRASCAPTSTRTWRRSSSSRPRTGPSRGCGRARTRTLSPTPSTASWSTGCAATRHPPDAGRAPV